MNQQVSPPLLIAILVACVLLVVGLLWHTWTAPSGSIDRAALHRKMQALRGASAPPAPAQGATR